MKFILELFKNITSNLLIQVQEIDSEFNWTKLFNPEFYINLELGGVPIGIYMVLFIVFAETGLFIGFFLPGDSLLFLSGITHNFLIFNYTINVFHDI